MFYISTLKELVGAVKEDASIEAEDKQKVIELVNKLICILALY